jgi:ubiquitin C-terminal hydrolase
MRVLFEAIEESFTIAGETNHLINQLYEGKQVSFVKCLTCGTDSNRDDKFQDLSLPIKNEFGNGVQNSSIEMALENYIKPEELKEEN